MIFTLPSVGLRSRYSITTVTTRCYSGAWRIKGALNTAIHALRRGAIPKTLPSMPKDSMRGYFPDTGARMRRFEQYAPGLAQAAVERLQLDTERDHITHLLITCCTGFSAPGLDLEVVERCKLPTSVEHTMNGFMGCYAAINALKLARHIVRSEPTAQVLILNVELCTLHLQETTDIEQVFSFLLFGDGCAACVVSADPVGAALDSFCAVIVPDTRDLITWNIRDFGFDMILSGEVPAAIHNALHDHMREILGGASVDSINL
jgi:predicted naringenin-chalcone synthase